MPSIIYGALRIRNEAKWIQRVIRSIQPVCQRIFVLDDYSVDDTAAICEAEGCTVFRNAVPWVHTPNGPVSDESAGKQWLLDRVFEAVPDVDKHFTKGNVECPYHILAIDGDEELHSDDTQIIRDCVETPGIFSWEPRIIYLWDSPNQWRTDGVYGRFSRPSLFRMMNRSFKYLKTPWGNGSNFHCSSIPQELQGHSKPCDARLLHWGYMERKRRVEKLDFYASRDRLNYAAEDCYRHVCQADNVHLDELPEVSALLQRGEVGMDYVNYITRTPAEAKLKWAGPLQLAAL